MNLIRNIVAMKLNVKYLKSILFSFRKKYLCSNLHKQIGVLIPTYTVRKQTKLSSQIIKNKSANKSDQDESSLRPSDMLSWIIGETKLSTWGWEGFWLYTRLSRKKMQIVSGFQKRWRSYLGELPRRRVWAMELGAFWCHGCQGKRIPLITMWDFIETVS